MAEEAVINLYPLAVMSVADHYTRDTVQTKRKRVYGGLFGIQEGREVHVLQAFAISQSEEAKSTMGLNLDAFEADMKLFEEVYPKYECLGWYSTGGQPDDDDLKKNNLFMKYNERPLYFLMDPEHDDEKQKEGLPIQIFYEEVQLRDGKTTNEFVSNAYKISSDEAERLTAVHCAKVGGTGESEASAVTAHYTNLVKASTMLASRIKTISQYLEDTNSGKIPKDHKTLRAIKGLCSRLPTMESQEFKEDFLNEYNDAMLVTYLSSITKSAGMLNDVVNKFNKANPGRGKYGAGHPRW